jgi:hypothetical protein
MMIGKEKKIIESPLSGFQNSLNRLSSYLGVLAMIRSD